MCELVYNAPTCLIRPHVRYAVNSSTLLTYAALCQQLYAPWMRHASTARSVTVGKSAVALCRGFNDVSHSMWNWLLLRKWRSKLHFWKRYTTNSNISLHSKLMSPYGGVEVLLIACFTLLYGGEQSGNSPTFLPLGEGHGSHQISGGLATGPTRYLKQKVDPL